MMRYKILSVAATVALGIALTPLWTPSASGAVQFEFTGNCVAGTVSCGQAEVTLILADTYEFGSPITRQPTLSICITRTLAAWWISRESRDLPQD